MLIAVLLNPDSNVNSNRTTKTSSATGLGGAYIKKEELFCGTENQFDEQIKWLAQGVMQFFPGCFSTAANIDVVILDYGITVTKARGVNNGQIYWVSSDSIERR